MTVETETKAEVETKGLVDAADRILRELIRTPKFKETILILLKSIDPPAARRLVRTLFWTDPGLFMSSMGVLPDLINVASEALAEVAAQMSAMPPPLLQDFLHRMVAGIDGAAMGEAVGGLVNMGLSLDLRADGGLKESLASLGEDFGQAYARTAGKAPLIGRLDDWVAGVAERAKDKKSATYAFVRAAGKAMQGNPDFVKHVLQPLLAPALKTPAKKSSAPRKRPAKPEKSGEE